jgi:hypothetical protein
MQVLKSRAACRVGSFADEVGKRGEKSNRFEDVFCLFAHPFLALHHFMLA